MEHNSTYSSEQDFLGELEGLNLDENDIFLETNRFAGVGGNFSVVWCLQFVFRFSPERSESTLTVDYIVILRSLTCLSLCVSLSISQFTV